MKHPIQPLYKDGDGALRFKSNAIVRFLLDNGPHDLVSLATEKFDQEDREQFAQLIGYSLTGFGELDYVSDEAYEKADVSVGEVAKCFNCGSNTTRQARLGDDLQIDPEAEFRPVCYDCGPAYEKVEGTE